MSSTGTQAIDRAAELLSLVVLADQPPHFSHLVSDTGLPKSTAFRLLQALERHRLVHRDDEGSYEAGSLFAAYASRHDPLDDFIALARPTLEDISAATGETVNLAVARRQTVVQVAQVDSTYLLGTTNWLGVDVPAHCSALGKVLYAAGLIAMPNTTLEARTSYTITHPDEFRRHLEAVRAKGFAQALSELEIGLDAVAAAVIGRSGEVVAAVGISGPSARINDKLPQLGALIKNHAQALSGVLGHQNRKEGAA